MTAFRPFSVTSRSVRYSLHRLTFLCLLWLFRFVSLLMHAATLPRRARCPARRREHALARICCISLLIHRARASSMTSCYRDFGNWSDITVRCSIAYLHNITWCVTRGPSRRPRRAGVHLHDLWGSERVCVKRVSPRSGAELH